MVIRKQAAIAQPASAVPPVSAPLPEMASGPGADPAVDTVQTAPWLKAVAPAPNIDQIADHVIRQIDSRMTAWRERMGKF